ncbi:MAG: hypothetical protein WCI51_23530, partial [Lentisphaerota bacterium]
AVNIVMLYAANSTLITGFIQIELVAQWIMVEISTTAPLPALSSYGSWLRTIPRNNALPQ